MTYNEILDTEYNVINLLDLDAHFRNSPDAILLNKIDFEDINYAESLNKSLYSQAHEMSFIASCECDFLNGNSFIGMECPTCKQEVKSPLASGRKHLPHKAWISFPDEIPGVLHPVAYKVIGKWLTIGRNRQNYINIILNPKLPLPLELEGVITGRGFKYFYDNFDYIIEFFAGFIRKQSVLKSQQVAADIKAFVTKYRHIMFVKYVPALSNVLHPITSADPSTNSRKYTDKGSQYILQTAQKLSYLEHKKSSRYWHKTLDTKIFEAYSSYIEYLSDITETKLKGKPGLLRRHVFGGRFHFSYRGVIVPITGPHKYDQLHLPWCIGVRLFKLHLIGRLVKSHKFTPDDAEYLLVKCESKYDKLIAQLLQEIIDESPFDGPGTWFNRNPSIQRGAIQLLYITKIKSDEKDKTIGMSPLILTRLNADFDGDALNGLLLLENDAVRAYETLHPSRMYLSADAPETSGDITLTKQALMTINMFLGTV